MKWRMVISVFLLTCMVSRGTAWAQQKQIVSEVVQAEKLDPGGNWIGMAIALLLAVCVGVGSFLSPKRSHLD